MVDRNPKGTGKVYDGDQFLAAVTYALDVLVTDKATTNLENAGTPLADTTTTGRLTFRDFTKRVQVAELLASAKILTLELKDGRRFSFVAGRAIPAGGLRIPIRLMGSNP